MYDISCQPYGHKFQIYTLVSEIHDIVNVVLGINNVYEVEGVINTRGIFVNFLNRLVSFFPKSDVIFKSVEEKSRHPFWIN